MNSERRIDESAATSRRAFLAAAAAALVGCSTRTTSMNTPASTPRAPAAFVSHGAPTLALDARRGADLRAWSVGLPKPSAYLVVSAHWERTPLRVGTTSTRELLYDFGGFPPELYRVPYAAPGDAPLAQDVIGRTGAVLEETRGWDHGVWVPLLHMAPDADVPVVQLSLPSRSEPRALLELGRQLASLRERGVFVLASGGLVHNLRAIDFEERTPPPTWATDFEAWARGALDAGDVDALVDYRAKAPALAMAHPTHEHFLPLLVALGAGLDESVRYPVSGFEYGNLSRTSVQFGA
jgi:4,5-DOPA dioxygenase extradiol